VGVFALVTLIAMVRIVSLAFAGQVPERTSLQEALLPPRGEITDRNGVPLARAFPAYALWFDPKAMGDAGSPLVRSPQEVARELKAIFPDINEARMATRLASGRSGYLRRRILPEEANKVFALGEVALEIPRETDRHYPQGTLAAHALGYVVEDKGGKLGMEQVLEDRLSDSDTRGTPVALSLDVRVQGALEDELRRGMLATNAIGAAGIVLDVDTGEVMAMASLPEFDPNTAGAAGAKNVFNRVTNGVYELGSTFKPISVAAAMDAGVVGDLSKQWNAAPVPVGSRTIKDSHPLGASLNVPQALVHSSNTVTARVADALGPEQVEAVLMPSRYTADMSNEDAVLEAEALGCKHHLIPIEPAFNTFLELLAPSFAGLPPDTTEENLQARCRGILLMAFSNKTGKILLTTGNKSEMSVGYATLYGDMAGGFAPLKDVPKMLVYRLAEYRNSLSPVIPQRVIDRPPSAELRPDQKDEDSLPPYPVLDAILERYVERDESVAAIIAAGYPEADVLRVARLVDSNEYKRRQAPPGVKISRRAFGRDRRYPMTNGFGN
jgi:NAD+ synthetase